MPLPGEGFFVFMYFGTGQYSLCPGGNGFAFCVAKKKAPVTGSDSFITQREEAGGFLFPGLTYGRKGCLFVLWVLFLEHRWVGSMAIDGRRR